MADERILYGLTAEEYGDFQEEKRVQIEALEYLGLDSRAARDLWLLTRPDRADFTHLGNLRMAVRGEIEFPSEHGRLGKGSRQKIAEFVKRIPEEVDSYFVQYANIDRIVSAQRGK